MDNILNINSHSLNIEEILKLLPHRYPFLLIDRVLDFKINNYLRAIKNISINEPFFQGHFPHKHIFPGVLIIEAMAQASGILVFKSKKIKRDELYYFVGIDNVRFKSPVVPGDQMIIDITFKKSKRNLILFNGTSMVDNKIVCKATMLYVSVVRNC